MRSAYRILAIVIAAEIVLQATAIAYAFFGFGKFIDDGAVVDKAVIADRPEFTGAGGFAVHAINGMMVIPALGLALLIVSLFARIPGGIGRAAIVAVLIGLQITLAVLGDSLPALGALHGLNALGIFSMALVAARKATVTGAESPAGAPAPGANPAPV